jgi:hypothetical protein
MRDHTPYVGERRRNWVRRNLNARFVIDLDPRLLVQTQSPHIFFKSTLRQLPLPSLLALIRFFLAAHLCFRSLCPPEVG